MKLQDMLHADAKYTRNSGAEVEINNSFGWVTISDTTGNQEDIFMQGHEAGEFISEVNRLWDEAGDIDQDTIACALAKEYIECIWE